MTYLTSILMALAMLNTAFSVSIVVIKGYLVSGWWANLLIAAIFLLMAWYYTPYEDEEETVEQTVSDQPEPKPEPLWFGVSDH